jgi:hypothetical protein
LLLFCAEPVEAREGQRFATVSCLRARLSRTLACAVRQVGLLFNDRSIRLDSVASPSRFHHCDMFSMDSLLTALSTATHLCGVATSGATGLDPASAFALYAKIATARIAARFRGLLASLLILSF